MVCMERFQHFLRDMEQKAVTVLLCGVRADFDQAMKNLHFYDWLPSERIFRENAGLPGSATRPRCVMPTICWATTFAMSVRVASRLSRRGGRLLRHLTMIRLTIICLTPNVIRSGIIGHWASAAFALRTEVTDRQCFVNGGLMDGWHALKGRGWAAHHALSGRATHPSTTDRTLATWEHP